jgi:hypothetical protein
LLKSFTAHRLQTSRRELVGKLVARDPNEDRWFLILSRDGSNIAFTKTPASPIQIFSRQGHRIRQIRVKGWSNLLVYDWAPDGSGFYVDAGSRGGHVLLYVDLQGNANRLWESPWGFLSDVRAIGS